MVRALVEHLPVLAPDWKFIFLRNPALARRLSHAPNTVEVDIAAAANGPATMWWLGRMVDLRGVDLFHAPSNILPAQLRIPCVTTIHDMMWMTRPELCNRGAWSRVERQFYRHGIARALRRSLAITTVSEATRQEIIAFAPELADRTFTVLSGVASAFTPGVPDGDTLGRLGLVAGSYVLTVGQSAPYKNHAAAMRGFAAAFPGDSGMKLVMVHRREVSTGPLAQLAETLGISGRVRMLPTVDDEQLRGLYRGALTLLHPSLCEGFGVPVAEAMASGCPVVTSAVSAMPEVTGGAALLVDPQDTAAIAAALQSIAENPALVKDLRVRGIRRAAELDWAQAAAGYLAVYRYTLFRD